MSQLALRVLGPFQVTLNERPLAGLESNKVRALLAYLAVEADRLHSRDELIGLLWPDQPDAAARTNLRHALANLRNAIGDRTSEAPFLSTTSDSIQFQRTEHCSIDAMAFAEWLAACKAHAHRRLETCRACAQRLQQAVELYRGDFLAQFVQSGSEAFEEWALIQRERLHREVLEALYHLTQHFEWRGDYAQALRYAQRQLELDPWREEAHRQIMRALALTEQRSAALAQYDTCRRALAEELGAEPAEETTALYEQIKVGAMAADLRQPRSWLPLTTPLIGREAELAEANAIWHQARTGEGQVLLIGGEPGIGKTRLTQELIAQEQYGHACVLLGECYAEGSAPFAPIAQVLQAIPNSQFPISNSQSSILADLITFVPALRDRFPDVPPNLPLEPQAEQQRRFESVASFLMSLAARTPVLLIIEDAHWADSATLSLLRHIARRARRTRLLIVATHREVDPDETYLFHEWLGDLQRERLASSINLMRLDKDDTRDLLAALFREAITPEFLDGVYDATEGNPFFVTEVCQALIDEGSVYRAGAGWQRLSMAQIQIPQSVRLAIQRRVDRLPETTQDTLQRAAVLGREFEFEVLQAMSDLDKEALIEALETAEHAQLVDEVARASPTARVTFAFAHALIPSTLHDGLSSLRRQRLHHRAAQAIEQLAQAANQVDDVATQLAQHYTAAGEIDKAIEYWLKAGDQARGVYAYDEAIEHHQQALALLAHLPDNSEREQRELAIQIALGNALIAVKGHAAPEVRHTFERAIDLCRQIGDTPNLWRVLSGLYRFSLARGDVHAAYELGEQLAHVAQNRPDVDLFTDAQAALGMVLLYNGEFIRAQTCFAAGMSQYDSQRVTYDLLGEDAGVTCLSYSAWALWLLGYPDQALARNHAAVTLARILAHPYNLAHALSLSALFHQFRGKAHHAQAQIEDALALSAEKNYPFWSAVNTMMLGWVLVEQGRPLAGTSQIRQGLSVWQAMGNEVGRSYFLSLLAQAQHAMEQVEGELATLAEALRAPSHIGNWWKAELYRLKGEALLQKGSPPAEVEDCFVHALDIARQQNAKSLELRAAVSLSRLWQAQGKQTAAHMLLYEIYCWFTEGFETTDLIEAQALLQQLANA